MNNINKYMEELEYIADKKRYYVNYLHKVAEEEIILSMTHEADGYFFNNNNVVRGLDKYNFDKCSYGFVEFFNKEQLDEIIQIEINQIRFRLRQKEDKIYKRVA